jgi:hypothetical protein
MPSELPTIFQEARPRLTKDTSRGQDTRPRSPCAPMSPTAELAIGAQNYVGGVLRFYDKHREIRPKYEAASPPVHCVDPTNNASPGEGFAPPPGRNPDNIASPPHQNLLPANNLQPPTEAKSTEFRLTKKKKKICRGEIPTAAYGPQPKWPRTIQTTSTSLQSWSCPSPSHKEHQGNHDDIGLVFVLFVYFVVIILSSWLSERQFAAVCRIGTDGQNPQGEYWTSVPPRRYSHAGSATHSSQMPQ